MILYIENPKDSAKKQPPLINKFGKVAGHKINIKKLVVFLYTNNELSEKLRNQFQLLFTYYCNKITRYLGINLTMEVKYCTQKIIRYWRD